MYSATVSAHGKQYATECFLDIYTTSTKFSVTNFKGTVVPILSTLALGMSDGKQAKFSAIIPFVSKANAG